MEIGREEGMEIGREEGAKQEKLKLAKNLLGVLDDETLAEKTGLSLHEIQSLRN